MRTLGEHNRTCELESMEDGVYAHDCEIVMLR